MAQVGFTQALSALWDSRRQLSVSGAARAGLFPRICLKLWDSRSYLGEPTRRAAADDLKTLKALPPWSVEFPRKTEGSRSVFAPYGMPVGSIRCSFGG